MKTAVKTIFSMSLLSVVVSIIFSVAAVPAYAQSCPLGTIEFGDEDGNTRQFRLTNPVGGYTEYQWAPGDGGAALRGQSARYCYKSAGAYTVTLTARDAAGEIKSCSADVAIAEDGQCNRILNPLGGVSTISEFLEAILERIRFVALAIVLPLAIIYAGFLFIKAQGKPDEITKARNTLLWTVVGAAIIIGAELLVKIINETLTGL